MVLLAESSRTHDTQPGGDGKKLLHRAVLGSFAPGNYFVGNRCTFVGQAETPDLRRCSGCWRWSEESNRSRMLLHDSLLQLLQCISAHEFGHRFKRRENADASQ